MFLHTLEWERDVGLGEQAALSLQRTLERDNKGCLFKDRSDSCGGRQGSPSRCCVKHLLERRRPAVRVNDRGPRYSRPLCHLESKAVEGCLSYLITLI